MFPVHLFAPRFHSEDKFCKEERNLQDQELPALLDRGREQLGKGQHGLLLPKRTGSGKMIIYCLFGLVPQGNYLMIFFHCYELNRSIGEEAKLQNSEKFFIRI